MIEGKVSELEDRSVETSQTKMQEEKNNEEKWRISKNCVITTKNISYA